jgi:hypothetical protein
MSLNGSTFGILKTGLLSAGLCDKCKVPKLINTCCDGIHEPVCKELYCKKKEIFIEPQLPENQVKECDGFEPYNN